MRDQADPHPWPVEVPGHHFVPYSGDAFDRALAATIEFLRSRLS